MDTKKLRQKILDLAIHGKLVPPVCRQAGKILTMNPEPPIKGKKCWFTYVIECEDGSFYKGYTDDLLRRYKQHCDGNGAEYTKKHKPKQLYYWEMHYTQENALNREKFLKSGIGREWFKREVVDKPENFEPASVLLERIRAEKERLVKEGKIKKSKASKTSDTPHYENVPIEVPASWSIIPLEYLATFSGGKTPSMDNKEYWNNGKHLWVTSKDMKSVHITDSLMKISDSALEQMNIYPKGTLLLVTRSGILRHTLPIAILGDEATVNQDIKTISCHFPNINRYLYYAIKAQEQVILEQYHKDGTTVDSIDFDKFKKLPIPLPPIEEQSRIIAEITRLFALVDTIENNQTDLESTIAQTKSKILDLAIHGKLVPQNPNDEPASELLKRINPKAEITCDNGQYVKIPEEWIICTIGDLFDVVSAKRVLKSDWKNKGIPFYRAREIVQLHKEGIADKDLFITEELFAELKDKFGTPNVGDIMLSAVGSIGYTYIVNEKDSFYYKDASVLCLRNVNKLNSQYFSMLFETTFVKEQMHDNSKGTTVDTITIEKLKKYFVPLPPLAEQYRIVIKIEELFSSLDNIQKALEV